MGMNYEPQTRMHPGCEQIDEINVYAQTTPRCLINALKDALKHNKGMDEPCRVNIWEGFKHDERAIEKIEEEAWQDYHREPEWEPDELL